MNQDWRQDPRLKGMDENKIKYLADLAAKVEHTPKDKMMPLLMSLVGGGNMNFNDQETDILVSIMTAGMSAAQKKQVETLRTLSMQFSKSNGQQSSRPQNNKNNNNQKRNFQK